MEVKNKVQSAILNSKEFSNYLNKLVIQLNRDCANANSESTIASRVESSLKSALNWYGEDFKPTREESVKIKLIKRVSSKRIDSRFKNIVTEYKTTLKLDELDENTNQLLEYILNLALNEKQALKSYVGILTDGNKVRFIDFDNENPSFSKLSELNLFSFKELIKIYLSLDKRNLSSINLLNDFSITNDNGISINFARSLYKSLELPSEKTFMLHSEWERLFKLASQNENNLKAIKVRNKVLSEYLDCPLEDFNLAKGLFALQTTYTVIIKLVAYYTISNLFFQKSDLKFQNLLKLDSNELRSFLEYMENGHIFHDLGITNLLEGGFFSWYIDESTWNNIIYLSLHNSIAILSEYDSNQILFNRNNIHDLFNDLYESIIPKEVRHSLGEYYTPGWLAEDVLSSIDKPSNWKGLDPCAGSGTFVLKMIQEILSVEKPESDLLNRILDRVKAIDINPLAVLTCRINYFIAISHLLDIENLEPIEIPVYLGDSAIVPKAVIKDNAFIVSYSIQTQKGEINFTLPLSVVSSYNNHLLSISELEIHIVENSRTKAIKLIQGVLSDKDKTDLVISKIEEFVDNLLYLEQQKWDRIWIRIIWGILKIATLSKFDFIIGNPPWIDWKSLPDGYRTTLKNIAIERHLFSGDKFTGGINLNICALISSVVASNWLKENGILAFLMPKSLAFQQSYSGFRRLIQNDGINLRFSELHDWSGAGHPFYPVTEKFLTYFLTKSNNGIGKIVPLKSIKIKKGENIQNSKHETLELVKNRFTISNNYAFINSGKYNNFTFESDKNLIPYMMQLAGPSYYIGRVGLGIYPKEILLFKLIDVINKEKVLLENFQGKNTERKYSKNSLVMETKYLHPVIEGPNISRYSLQNVSYFAALPYTQKDIKKPITPDLLTEISPLLYKYYLSKKDLLRKTEYNQRVQGGQGAFYSMTRVGLYTFAKYRVVFRNNTKWNSCVISETETPWGETKSYLLLDHACSLSQDITGIFINEDEAHYICAILNSELVTRYMINSSDSRSFKTDIIIHLEKYNPLSSTHKELSDLSKKAHNKSISESEIKSISERLIHTYLQQVNKNLKHS